jgi:hypothetical protein
LTIWKHFPADNVIEIGVTRFDRQNRIGQGSVGQVVIELETNNPSLQALELTFDVSNNVLVTNNNTIIPIGNTSASFTLNGEITPILCDAPTNLQETGLTCTDVTLRWDAMPDAQAYQLRGRKAGRPLKVFPQTQNTSRTFTGGLQSNKTYEWGVRTKCNGVWTAYTPFNSFSTPTCKNSTYDPTQDPFLNQNENFLSQIKLYPNPAKNDLYIQFSSFENENINIKVVDILGKTVLIKDVKTEKGENSLLLNIKDLRSGTYFLQIENSFEQTVEKFLVL